MKNMPEHVAIVMDGNGRWARNRGLPRAAGHKAGIVALREAVKTRYPSRDQDTHCLCFQQ